jgi:5-methylcytosine-specific restriction protein A
MSRALPEWIAKHDNEVIPARVKLRVFDRCGGHCQACTLPIRGKLLPAYDHIKALINGGEHRETNLQLLCVPCHAVKTRQDVAEKSDAYQARLKAVGIKPAKRHRWGYGKGDAMKKKISGEVVRR